MKTRKLRNLEVSAVGMGCMGFTHGYGACPTEEESIRSTNPLTWAVRSLTRQRFTPLMAMNCWLAKH